MEKYSGTKDRRIEKTKKSIRDAFVRLTSEKDISQITIKELAEEANINRKTFYMHYSSIDDILDKLGDEILKKFVFVLDKHDYLNLNFDEYAFFRSFNELINEDFDFYQKLVCTNANNFLMVKVKNLLKNTLIERYHEKIRINKEMLNLYAEYAASGVMSMYIEWFNMNSKLSLEDLAKAASNIAFNGINSIVVK